MGYCEVGWLVVLATRSFVDQLSSVTRVTKSDEEGLGLDLKGGDWVEGRILEGFLKMSNSPLGWQHGTGSRLLGRRTKPSQGSANGRLGLKKSFPNSVGGGVAHGATKLLEGQ